MRGQRRAACHDGAGEGGMSWGQERAAGHEVGADKGCMP